MSKYVRIDNGVYKVGIDKEAKERGVSNYYYIEVDKGVRLTFDEEELNKGKLGDTIEELCDEFVLIKNNNEGFQFWKDLDALKQCSGYFIVNDFDNVYGAIWTNKGLIYVAKMNEKGELELLCD